MATGTTDSSGTDMMDLTGPTGTFGIPSPPAAETGTASAPMVIDIAELLASHEGIKSQENTDRAVLSPLLNETRELLRPQLFAWAGAGFPDLYVIQQFSVSLPAICSDGVTRSIYDYVVYLLGQEMGQVIAGVQALCVGVQISYSFAGNSLRIHVTRA